MRTLISLLIALSLQVPTHSGVIEGLVLRARTEIPVPLVNARVVIELNGEQLVVRTDSSGRFQFSGLPPGRYRLRVTKDGFIRQEYPHAAMGAPGLPIDLSAGQEIRNIVFRMETAPTISGVIRDDRNAPVAGVVVEALRRGYNSRGSPTLSLIASAKTDDRGAYRLYWLDNGEYFIAANPSPSGTLSPGRTPMTLASTYFPGFPALDDAKPVRLEGGRDAHGMDFALIQQALGPVHGVVTSLTTGKYVVATVTLTAAAEGSGVARFQTRSRTEPPPPARDNYSIPAVPPGSYILTAVSGNEQASSRILVRGSGLIADLRLGPGVAIVGRITGVSDSANDLRATRVRLTEVDSSLPSIPEVAVAQNGSFVIPAVQPGSYSVSVTGLPGDLYVRAALFAGASILEKPLPVAYGRSDQEDLAIQIGADGGRITGVVFDQNNTPFAGAQVTLVPEGAARARFDLYRTAISGLDGAFAIRGVVPGDYTLFAWDDLEPNAYLNAEYVAAYRDRGTPVRVEPGLAGSVPLRLIPAER